MRIHLRRADEVLIKILWKYFFYIKQVILLIP